MDEVINPDILGSYLERTLDKGLQRYHPSERRVNILSGKFLVLTRIPTRDKEQMDAIQEAGRYC